MITIGEIILSVSDRIKALILAIYLFFGGLIYGNSIDLDFTAKAEMTDYGCVVIAEVTNNGKPYMGTNEDKPRAPFYRIVDGKKVYGAGLTSSYSEIHDDVEPYPVLVKHGETRTLIRHYYFTDDYKPGEYFVDVTIPDCDKVYTFTFTLT